jgi:hypothetical protein
VQRVPLGHGDRRYGGRRTVCDGPGSAGFVGRAAGWGDHDPAALAASLGEHLAAGIASQLGVARYGSVGDAVEQVQATGGGLLGVPLGGDPHPHVGQAAGVDQFAYRAEHPGSHRPALHFQHLQAAGHGPADDAESGATAAEPLGDHLPARPLVLVCLPLGQAGALGAVHGGGQHRNPGVMPGECGCEHVTVVRHRCSADVRRGGQDGGPLFSRELRP